MKKYVIGIDLGGTKICTAIADKKGNPIHILSIPTEASKGLKHVLDQIVKSVSMVSDASGIGLKEVASIGVGAPGPVDERTGSVSNAPNLPGWKVVPLRDILKKRLGKKILLENDANCAAVAEQKLGAGKPFHSFVYVTVSTGIGGGIIINNELFRGATGSAGEVGHMVIDINGQKCSCGQRGHIEGLAAGPAIEKRSGIKPKALEEMANKGNKKALKEIEYTGMLIGTAFANIVNILNPQAIIVGGGVSSFGSPLFDSIKKTVKEKSLTGIPVKILPAKLKKNVGVMGAIALCL